MADAERTVTRMVTRACSPVSSEEAEDCEDLLMTFEKIAQLIKRSNARRRVLAVMK
jgi:hypothetical protein